MKRLWWIVWFIPLIAHGEVKQSTFTVSAKVVANPSAGKSLFDSTCVHCHTFQDLQNASERDLHASLTRPDHKFNLSTRQIQDLAAHLQTYY